MASRGSHKPYLQIYEAVINKRYTSYRETLTCTALEIHKAEEGTLILHADEYRQTEAWRGVACRAGHR